MSDVIGKIRKQLMTLQDEKYREFQCRLMPTVDPANVIGVRTPILRGFAKELRKTLSKAEMQEFLHDLPHRYYEENNLHAFLIEQIKDFDQARKAVDDFLPYVDNWATCDSMSPKVFKKHMPEMRGQIDAWIASGETYTVRFAIGLLMSNYLGDYFEPEMPEQVAAVKSDEYYVKMMVAWYFATALAKQRDIIMPYFEKHRLEKWTHNKAIQKCIESFRISEEDKNHLRALKVMV